MDNKFKPLNDEYKDTVVSFSVSMFKVSNLIAEVKEVWLTQGIHTLRNKLANRGGISGNNDDWFARGVSCEILKPGNKSWKKGKIKISINLEFCPDEPEIDEIMQSNDSSIKQASSPLDDIRQMMNKDN